MAKRRKVSARHVVSASLHADDLAKLGAALTLIIKDRGAKRGELQIGQGGLRWWGKYDKKPRRLTWRKFVALVDQSAIR